MPDLRQLLIKKQNQEGYFTLNLINNLFGRLYEKLGQLSSYITSLYKIRLAFILIKALVLSHNENMGILIHLHLTEDSIKNTHFQ
jgi:hypothetical protein